MDERADTHTLQLDGMPPNEDRRDRPQHATDHTPHTTHHTTKLTRQSQDPRRRTTKYILVHPCTHPYEPLICKGGEDKDKGRTTPGGDFRPSCWTNGPRINIHADSDGDCAKYHGIPPKSGFSNLKVPTRGHPPASTHIWPLLCANRWFRPHSMRLSNQVSRTRCACTEDVRITAASNAQRVRAVAGRAVTAIVDGCQNSTCPST